MHLFTLPAEIPFLDHLARHVLALPNPEECLILLPSRRACMALGEAFLNVQDGKPLLLPRIQPIGDVNEEALAGEAWMIEALRDRVAGLKPALSTRKRELMLAELVARFNPKNEERLVHEYALKLARELARLMDDAEREQVDLNKLAEIVPAELAAHWQQTLSFLTIITTQWPNILEQDGVMNPVARRNALLQLLAESWRESPPAYPVIAAGSTGSTPATAQLLKVIAELPNGQVWLPGLDTALDEASWEALGPTHPQYAFKQLLTSLQVARENVAPLAAATSVRGEWLRTALLPAESTPSWRECALDAKAALAGVSQLEASDQHEEAAAIAAILRDALATREKKTALITHDRTLARMVRTALQRFDIAIDDSAGVPLITTPTAQALRLLAEMVVAKAAPVALLAYLKHPSTTCAMPRAECRELARNLEVSVLRGERLKPSFAALKRALKPKEDCARLLPLVEILETATADFAAYFNQKKACFSDMLAAHLRAAEALSTRELLWSGEAGEQLAELLGEWREFGGATEIAPRDYPALLVTLLESEVYRPRYGKHPRVQVLSPMEARLQYFDLVVFGEMSESVWPQAVQASPWMSRPMQQKLGLSPLEKTIGQSAHDFVQLMSAAGEVVLTRARRIQGRPAIASRWWQRMEALLKGLHAEALWEHHPALEWVEQLQAPVVLPALEPPAPAPPLSARPRELPVTAIEKWLRDPYAIYARYILKLKPLDEVDQVPDASAFGQLVHDALEAFLKQYPSALPEDPKAALMECGRGVFAAEHHAAAQAFWWPRFEAIAEAIIEEEKLRRQRITRVSPEVKGRMQIDAPNGAFILTARMDRVEEYTSGTLGIVDYKTGGIPQKKELEAGVANQLALEALIAEQGTLEGVSSARAQQLEYWRLAGSHLEITTLEGETLDATTLMAQARTGLEQLVVLFDDAKTPYLAVPDTGLKPRYNDYEHLERLEEWS